jgi:mono/diheme cytochrome c family protein
MRILTLFIAMSWFPQLHAQPSPNSGSAGDTTRGEQLFVSLGCYQCHNNRAQGGNAGARLAPPVLSFPAFRVLVRTPINQMPPYTATMASDQELADIHAYLATIPDPPSVDSIPLLNE